IPAHAFATVIVNFTVPSSTTGSQTNTATVSSPVADPNNLNNTASDTDSVATSADLSVTKSDGVSSVTAGDGVTWTYVIHVANSGPSDATNVSLSDTWPAGFAHGIILSPSQGTCSGSPDFTCSLGTIPKNGFVNVTASYTVPSSTTGDQTNTVTVSSPVSD